ncbi:MAG: hypothetical protein KUG77_29395, partial [Nannocystaceae bacterium]|nr:hypothetical protein [Nannocystaceae bacterium]
QALDPDPEWDRPMPFVDQGWICPIATCVWSEDAAKKARILFYAEDERPKTAFCFSGVFNNERTGFSPCTKKLDTCEVRRRKGYPDSTGSKPCREMTPTEFWRENPKLVEVHRKICKPQECPAGHRSLGAAKIKGETLPIDDRAITQLGDGILLVDPSEPNWPGALLGEDDACEYGCILRKCDRSQHGCIDTKSTSCNLCFDDQQSAAECRRLVERCREVDPLVREAYDTCVFADIAGGETEERFGCPSRYTCHRLYDETYPRGFRVRGICKRAAKN